MSATNDFGMIKNICKISSDLLVGYKLKNIDSRFSLIWCLIFGSIGIVLRFYRLGSMPLSDVEVGDALLAWLMVNGQHLSDPSWLANSSLVHFGQVILFWITGTANPVSARLISAICGSALIFAPMCFARHIGKGGVHLTMAMLAVSPSLVMVSRTADGIAIALICLVIALAGVERAVNGNGSDGISLIILGVILGITCGRSFTIPLLLVVFILMRNSDVAKRLLLTFRASFLTSTVTCIVAVLLISTTFFGYRYGFMAMGESWVQWISGWSPYTRMRSVLLIPEISLSNQPLLMLLSVVGCGIALRGRSIERTMSIILVCGLLYGLVYSEVQSTDVVWVIIPLFVLCARVALGAFQGVWSAEELFVIAIQGAVLGSLMVFGYFLFGGLVLVSNIDSNDVENHMRVQALILLGMMMLVVSLFSVGWSWKVSKAGVIMVILVVSMFWSVHRSWNLIRFPNNGYVTNWYTVWPTGTGNLMLETLEKLSLRFVGQSREVDITVISPYNRQLAWRLREFSNVEWNDNTILLESPSVIITSSHELSIGAGSGYIGQEFRISDSFGNDRDILVRRNEYSKASSVNSGLDKLVIWARQGDASP